MMPTTLSLNPAMRRPDGIRVPWLHGLAFGAGLISFLYVNVIGQLYVVELALPLLGLLLWESKHGFVLQRPFARVMFFGLLWLLAQISTDLIRGTPWHDLIRGWFAIGVFLGECMVVYMLVSERPGRLYALMLGMAAGGVLQPFVQPSPFFHDEPWKFGFGPPLAMLMMAWLGMRDGFGKRIGIPSVLLMLAFGILSVYWNARSLGGFVLLTGLLIWFRSTGLGRVVLRRRFRPDRAMLLAIIVLALGLGVVSSYEHAASKGWMGQQALYKYRMDTSGHLGLLIGGRPDLIPGIFAVMDSPIIGHGSWAKGPRYRKYLLLLLSLGYDRSRASMERAVGLSDLIPTHSHLLQAWVWAGILGAVFWIFILYLVFKAIFLGYRYPGPFSIPVLYLGLTDIWNILFSPFGAQMRFHWALTLTLYLMTVKHARQGYLALR